VSVAELTLGLAGVLFAAGVAAAAARPHGLSTLVAGQLGLLGAILAVVVLLGEAGRVLAVAAAALAGAHGGLVLTLSRGGQLDETDEEDPSPW
jgi:hypothetical protein